MDHSKLKAIDLFIEDLHTKHYEIRSNAKKHGCEKELDIIKQQLLDYLNFLRKLP
jgi:hypothetical protein